MDSLTVQDMRNAQVDYRQVNDSHQNTFTR